MSLPKYRYRHQQTRQRWAPIVNAGQAQCAEPICLMPTRTITPGQLWHLCHDETGTHYIGVGHALCNTTEGAKRAHHPPPTRRWVL